MSDAEHLAAYAWATKIAYMHRRIWSRWMTDREAISAAYYGTVCAMETKPGIEIPATFLWARGAIIKECYWLRYWSQKPVRREFCDVYEEDIRIEDDSFRAFEDRNYIDAAMLLIHELAPLQREILCAHISGRKTSDIAGDLGIKATTASFLLGRAHREMSCRARGYHVAMVRDGKRRVAQEVYVGGGL